MDNISFCCKNKRAQSGKAGQFKRLSGLFCCVTVKIPPCSARGRNLFRCKKLLCYNKSGSAKPQIKNIGGPKMDNNSLAHTKWECKYHIVFAPKYHRQVIYKQIKADVAQILGTLCRRKGIEIIEAQCCADHIRRKSFEFGTSASLPSIAINRYPFHSFGSSEW